MPPQNVASADCQTPSPQSVRIEHLIDNQTAANVCVWYLADAAAVGEAGLGEPNDFSWRVVAHHIQVMLQRRVLGALEVNQLGLLIHPDLRRGRTLHKTTKTKKYCWYTLLKATTNKEGEKNKVMF